MKVAPVLITVVAVLLFMVEGCTCSPESGERGAIYASFDVECGDKTYAVGTGSNKGECKKSSDGQSGICKDKAGNEAIVSCESGCISTTGSGSCSRKEKSP